MAPRVSRIYENVHIMEFEWQSVVTVQMLKLKHFMAFLHVPVEHGDEAVIPFLW